jgi:hypothetical protein
MRSSIFKGVCGRFQTLGGCCWGKLTINFDIREMVQKVSLLVDRPFKDICVEFSCQLGGQ